MDNAGENKKLEEILKLKKLNIYFEYTPFDGADFNGVVERAFATGYGRVQAMLNGGGFFEKNRSAFWVEAASTAADLNDILAYKSGTPRDFFKDAKEPRRVR